MASAEAQTVVGGDREPSVSVDLTVLDRLGPAPTLPQLFGASRGVETPAAHSATPAVAPRSPSVHRPSGKHVRVAKRTSKKKTRRVAQHKTTSRTQVARAAAPAQARSTKHSVQLTPPAIPAAAPQPTTPEPTPPSSIERAAAVTVTAPPAAPPMPAPPQSIATPAAPAVAMSAPPEPPPAAPSQTQAPAPPVSLMAAPPPAPEPAAPAAASAAPPSAASADNTAAAASHSTPVQVASVGQVATTRPVAAAPSAVKFAPGVADLPPDAKSVLDGVAAKLLASDALRVQLIAHASGGADQAMEARRISLARAVAVRAYLIDKGVRSLRMDVRALGNRADEGPVGDQVDLVIVSQ